MLRTILLGTLLLAAAPSARPPASGQALIQQMHDRYADTWYHTLRFQQQTTRTAPDGIKHVETWYETASIPGILRIDIAPLDSGRAIIYDGPRQFIFRHDSLVAKRNDRNLLMTLGFDVYAQPPATTAAQLEAEGMDLSKIREDTWHGRPVYVVGAAPGDSTSNQFWIDRDRLLFVRLIQRLGDPAHPENPAPLLEATFDKYQKLDGGWIAPLVVAWINGREVQREEYSNMIANLKLPDGLFDTTGTLHPLDLKR